MTLVCSVMAWAVPVTTLEELQAALNAGGEVTLGASINAGATELIVDKDVVLDLNSFTLSGSKSNDAAGVLRLTNGTLTVKATNGGGITATSQLNAIYVVGGTLNLTAGTFSGSYEGIMGVGGTINITGGTYTSSYDNAIWAKGANLNISGGEFDGSWYDVQIDMDANATISGGTFAGDNDGTLAIGPWGKAGDISITGGTFNGTNGIETWYNEILEISGGVFAAAPSRAFVSAPLFIEKVEEQYHISNIGSNVAVCDYVAYPTLAAAVNAATDGSIITMYTADNNAVTASHNLTIETKGYASNVSAGAGYGKIVKDQDIIITSNTLIAFLMGDESEYTLTEDADISEMQVVVKGTKTLTINEGVTVTCAIQNGYNYPQNIQVPEGAKLTILGKGTISGNQCVINVMEGGELVIGAEGSSDAIHVVTSVKNERNYAIRNVGKLTIHNIDVNAANGALGSYGELRVNGGRFVGHATSNGTSAWRYCVVVGGKATINNATIIGTHGALSAEESGSIEVNNCDLQTVLDGNTTNTVFYSLYVCTKATVSVKNTKMKSVGTHNNVLIGDNDAYNTFGLIYLYDGCLLDRKMYVSKKQGKDADLLFPLIISTESDWYKVALKGGYGPLPAGYEYKAIIAEGEPTDEQVLDATAYADGYRWKVVGTATETAEVDENATTIPWQQSSTWDASASSSSTTEVPTAATVVTIPEGKTVVISADENENNGITEAKAEQIFLADGATLTVQSGTTLTVGDGGMNIADGGQLVIEQGAIVTVGDAGLIAANDDAVVIEASETGSGAFLISPDVTENTQPYATVEMYAKAHKDGDTWYAQHFGIPTYNTPEIGWAPGNTWVHKFGENGWENITSLSELQPFVGYKLTNNSAVAAGKYTFTGNIIGNGNAPISFVKPYYNLLANSYTAPMSLAALFTDIENQYGNDVDLTVWIYKSDEDRHVSVTKAAVLSGEDPEAITTIAPMQGFILYCGPTQPLDGVVNYEQAIWNNTDKTGVPIMAPARDAQDESVHATIVVTSEKSKDEVVLRENNEYSNAFDNGADARKYMSERVFDFYSVNNGEAFSQVATDDLAGTELTMKAKDETVYTMSFRNVNNFDYEIRDNLSGAIIPVVEGTTYEFTMAEGTTAEARFEIVGGKKVVTDIENIGAVKAAKGVYTVLGQYLGESSLLNTLPTGIYVVDGQRIVK